nr:3-phosphoshikimate 1-carboxyvinyltransferase [Spelaeicoccus albus]
MEADLSIPGSKSLTNRYLILASIADEPSRIRLPLHSRDTELMAAALRRLGVEINETDEAGPFGADWLVKPPARIGAADAHIDCGLAGTVMRFIPPLAALSPSTISFDGDDAARRRPMSTTIDSLRALGVRVEDGGRGALPFTTSGSPTIRGGCVTMDAGASSQFVSGLLLAGCRYELGVDIRHVGDAVPSGPHIEMTTEALRDAGLVVDDSEPNRWAVEPGVPRGLDVAVEPDLSNAAPFVAAALVAGGTVLIRDWPTWTTQAGDRMRSILEMFGADLTLDRAGLTVTGSGEFPGIDIDLHDVGELTPVVAAIAALASSPSRLTGIAHLRGHETDRLTALTTELTKLGGRVTETDAGLDITPSALHGGVFETYHDHRMAMAAAVLGLRVPGLQIADVATTAKTLPEFPELWSTLAQPALAR